MRVLQGEDTGDAKTHCWVFSKISSTVHPTLLRPFDFEVDIAKRTARVSIPGVLEATGRPIISPATGDEHRVRIDFPHGIEFEIAEVGSASCRATAAVPLELNDSYGQFNRIHHTGKVVVRRRTE